MGKLARRANSNELEIPCGEKSRFSKEKNSWMQQMVAKLMLPDVSVSEVSLTAAEQLKPKEKQIEDVTGKFRYGRFGYL